MAAMSTIADTPRDPDTSDPDIAALVRMLDAVDALPAAATLRQRGYELLDLPAGAAVVDMGCGTGRAVAELAERGARPIGVDVDERMTEEARRRWPGIDVRTADACRLPIGTASLAGYRADKVLHALADPARALAEASRVLAPGGRIVLIGQDWDAVLVDADDRDLTRTIVHARADTIPSPWAARRYRNLLLDAGFRDPAVEVHTAVFTDDLVLPLVTGLASAARATDAITEQQAGGWTAEQADRARDGRLFLALPLFLASAHRP